METLAAIQQRKSIRAYTDQPVAHEDIEEILTIASRAPSGVNIQPWQVAVVQGETKAAITEALIAARRTNQESKPDYDYYPTDWEEPFNSRRIACGRALYEALGIGRKERKKSQQQAWENNYRFFGAPVGLYFYIDRSLNKGSWIDMGMFIQNIMIAATAKGLGTCPQASVAEFPDIVRNILEIDEQYILMCGMALGYTDTEQAVNQYQLPREPTDTFTRWFD